MSTVHIESKKEDIANTVLMPGDPKRAEYIARNYLENAKLVNLVRGITAYTGYYKGKKVTVFPSGMGNPSIGIYSYELFKFYDVDNIIRIGSCGAYSEALKLNDIILVDNSVSESTYALVQNGYKYNKMQSSGSLNDIILNTAKNDNINVIKGYIYCSDVFYEKDGDYIKTRNKYNVLGVEMETFALFTNANTLKKRAACLLTVSDSFCFKEKLSSEEREKNLNKMITLALDCCLKL